MAVIKEKTNSKRRHRWLALFLIAAVSPALPGFALSPQPEISREYQIKAVFLFNFTQFIEWPENAFPDPDSPLVIGILGRDPFGGYLEETVFNEKVKGHPLLVRRFERIDDIDEKCHILFVNLAGNDQLEKIFDELKTANTLTVGDVDDFARQGGMIEFFMEANKIRIRVNLGAVEETDIAISSKLLRLAEIIPVQNN